MKLVLCAVASAILLSLAFSGGFAKGPASAPAASGPSTSAPASKPASAPAGGEWTKLFADEKWYKDQAGKEEVFTGKLEAVPEGGPNILMRTCYYKVGARNVHTLAKKVPALDKLVGKKVELRGKAVDMELEGKNLREIWPAAVRPAAD